MKCNCLFGIRSKVLWSLGVLCSVLFLFSAFIIKEMRQVDTLSSKLTSRNKAISWSAHEALSSAQMGSLSVQKALLLSDKKDQKKLRQRIKSFGVQAESFEMFIKSLIWGTESEAFKRSKNGSIYSKWTKNGWDKKIVLTEIPGKVRQWAGSADIYFSGFLKYSRQILGFLSKSHEFHLIGDERRAQEQKRRALHSYEKSQTYQDLVEMSLNRLSKEISNVSALEQQEIKEFQRRRNRHLILLGFGMFSFVILAGWIFASRELVKPIENLIHHIQRVKEGEFKKGIPIVSKDEIGLLTKNFNELMRELDQSTVSKEFFDNIIMSMADSLVVVNLDWTIQLVNQVTCDLLGYKEEELKGKSVELIFGNNYKKDELEMFIDGRHNKHVELTYHSRDGRTIPISVAGGPIKDHLDKIHGFAFLAKDLSEKKRIEARMLRSEKLSAVGQLAAGVAHEINNPLGIILGFVQGLLRNKKPGGAMDLPLRSIEREANRCKELVRDLLTFSRTSRLERGPLEINQTVKEALSLVKPQARIKQIEVRQDLQPNLPCILGNENQIQQVIINLANNAMAVLPENGILSVKTFKMNDASLFWVVLIVSDNGPGIPADVLPRIFEPFYTTKPIGKGTGLGLSLVHEIVRKHSGLIDVESRPGLTEFRIRFPIRTEAELQSIARQDYLESMKNKNPVRYV